MNLKIIYLITILIANSLYAQNENKLIRKGNSNYFSEKYNDSEINFRKALEKNPISHKGIFNLGDALYKQNNYPESSRYFTDLSQRQMDNATKAKVFHNLGNSKLQYVIKSDTIQPQQKQQYLMESINAFKNSLKLNPKDMDTKYNLQYAKHMLQNMQQQGDGQNQDNKEDQKQDEQKQNEQKKENKNEQQQSQPKDQISKQDAERMLDALKNDEKNTMDKVKSQEVKPVRIKIEKDW